jgi:vacuolar-type H+-ATPase subunit C/Vma6
MKVKLSNRDKEELKEIIIELNESPIFKILKELHSQRNVKKGATKFGGQVDEKQKWRMKTKKATSL